MRSNIEEKREPGFWSKVKNSIWLGNYSDEEYEDEDVYSSNNSRQHMRVRVPASNLVSVWKTVKDIDHADQIALSFKNAQVQIVNLEGVDDVDSQRIYDFLAGTVFALNGSMKKLSEKVYMLLPANFDSEEPKTEDRRNSGWK